MEKIGRKKAASLGITKYFTGKPCKRGHLSYRHVFSGSCLQCAEEARAELKKIVMEKRAELEADNASY